MLQFIYRAALVAVVVCVLVVLIAPDIDLPDSTGLRANHGAHILLNSIQLMVSLLLLVVMALFAFRRRELVTTLFDAPSHPLLCTFLC